MTSDTTVLEPVEAKPKVRPSRVKLEKPEEPVAEPAKVTPMESLWNFARRLAGERP